MPRKTKSKEREFSIEDHEMEAEASPQELAIADGILAGLLVRLWRKSAPQAVENGDSAAGNSLDFNGQESPPV